MNHSMGTVICNARKAKGMTQGELAELLHVTDKAVSKWERDICCPDIVLLPQISEILNIGIEELLSGKVQPKSKRGLCNLVLIAVSFALGVAVFILSVLDKLNLLQNGMGINHTDMTALLGLGILLLAFLHLRDFRM